MNIISTSEFNIGLNCYFDIQTGGFSIAFNMTIESDLNKAFGVTKTISEFANSKWQIKYVSQHLKFQ